jgi:vacuolar-type H+-ATPase subunit E/Vma4
LKNKIRVDNTLDKRLELFRQNATPEIRKRLFGKDSEMKKNENKIIEG